MIVTTKEAFELKCTKEERQCLLRRASVLLDPCPDPRCPSWGLQCGRFLSNPITMMGMLDYNSDADDDDAEDDDPEDDDADDDNEHKWK